MTDTFFVSHQGDDRNNCGNWTKSCRTVRHAVKMTNEGDQIFIDYARGRPYMECENPKQSRYPMDLTKSLSFYGVNGKPEIRCTKWYGLFNITSPNVNITRIKFFNLVISNSNSAVRLAEGTRSELQFQNVLVRNNQISIYSKNSDACSILIANSTFEHNFPWGTRLQCHNLTVQIMSSTFKLTPVFIANVGTNQSRWTNMRVWVQNTVVDGQNTQTCAELLSVKPFADVLNVTITNSQFKNHVADCRYKDQISALHLYGHNSKTPRYTNIFLNNLLIENNYNTWSAFTLASGYQVSSEVKIMLRDSTFKNNSMALQVRPYSYHSSSIGLPTIFLENNTFVDNIFEHLNPNGAPAIYFASGKSLVSACRFLDNKVGRNPYTGVVTISQWARVTFSDTYFENRQTTAQSNQLFASGNQKLHFIGHNTINLIALKEKQSIFTRIPTAINAGVIIDKNFKILCPLGYKLNSQLFCKVVKNRNLCYYINVQCEQCATKTYTLERGKLIFNKSNNIQCKQCPRGGNCDSGLVTAKPNFWGYKTNMRVEFVQCPPGYCCKTEDCVNYYSCNGKRSGTLCGQCPAGFSESLFTTRCITNTKCSLTYFFIFGMITFLVIYVVFFLYHKEILNFFRTNLFSKRLSFPIGNRHDQGNICNTDGNVSSFGGMIKIFFYYYQVCNLLSRFTGSSKGEEFISNFEDAISRIMNMVLINLPFSKCPFKNLRPIPKAVVVHSVGYYLLGLLCLLHLFNKLFLFSRRLMRGRDSVTASQCITTRSNHESGVSALSFSQRLVSAFTYISLLMYASSAQLCLSLLHCVPVGENQVLFLDGNVKCYQPFQFFLIAYMVSSILPFCLVPVLGSYLLKFGRIRVKQFCAACIFPLPFCCFWMYLLLKNSRCKNQGTYSTIKNNDEVTDEQGNNDTESFNREEITFQSCTVSNGTTSSESVILSVLLGPFRSHRTFVCFPASHIPWEGCLIFRRLVLIIVLTFVYNIQLRLFLTLTLCVGILMFHMFVNPFQRKRDNVLESFSLGTHVVLCGLTLIKALYYGEDYSFSNSLPVLNVIANILVVAPLSVIMIVVIFCIVVKLAFVLNVCVSFCIHSIRRLLRCTM